MEALLAVRQSLEWEASSEDEANFIDRNKIAYEIQCNQSLFGCRTEQSDHCKTHFWRLLLFFAVFLILTLYTSMPAAALLFTCRGTAALLTRINVPSPLFSALPLCHTGRVRILILWVNTSAWKEYNPSRLT